MLDVIFYLKTDKTNKNGLSTIFAKVSLSNGSISLIKVFFRKIAD